MKRGPGLATQDGSKTDKSAPENANKATRQRQQNGGQKGQGQKRGALAKVGRNSPAKVETGNRQPAARQNPKSPASVVELKSVQQLGVARAQPRRRHLILLASFLLLVVLPALLTYFYLWGRAEDRYASVAAFSVHREDAAGSAELMAGLPALGVSAGATSDTDVLYQFIQSQRMVELVNEKVDLRQSYGAAYDKDPIFALSPNASLEEMVGYWDQIMSVVYEPDTRLISIEVSAFQPQLATQIAQIVLDESGKLINDLSDIAQEDTIRQAREELDKASEELKETRLAMSRFRDVEQIVDPTADFTGQMGVITALQQSLADAMIKRDMLVGTTTNANDPRIQQAERTIEAIQARIAGEREKVGARTETADGDPLSRVVGEYESLVVDREFAEKSYLAARASYDAAVAEARRRSRYLAVHIPPTQAETAIYPNRPILATVATVFLLLAWALLALTVYSIRDRR